MKVSKRAFVHQTACVDEGAVIGEGSKIWHFSHVCTGARIGKNVVLGQNVFVAPTAVIGDGCKIQNNVSVYDGINLGKHVFCGPSVVFTNVINPRGHVEKKNQFRVTHIGEGATVGANATVVCGVTIGKYAFIGAGSVVTTSIEPYSLYYGNPARHHGWVCKCGEKITGLQLEVKCTFCGESLSQVPRTNCDSNSNDS